MGLNRIIIAVFIVGAIVLSGGGTSAHESTKLAALGYPELNITANDGDFSIPDTVPAGRTLIIYENKGQAGLQSWLVRVPDDVTAAELAAPVAAGEAPTWFYRGVFVGFPGFIRPGETTNAVVDLTPGLYAVYDDFSEFFRVTPNDATPAASVEPVADATIDLVEYDFLMPERFAAGDVVWKVTNSGQEAHELVIAKSPVPVTKGQIVDLLMADDPAATPTGGGPSLNDLEAGEVAGFGTLSPGASGWTELTFEPGTYVVICFLPSPDGMPHVAHGMIAVFTVV